MIRYVKPLSFSPRKFNYLSENINFPQKIVEVSSQAEGCMKNMAIIDGLRRFSHNTMLIIVMVLALLIMTTTTGLVLGYDSQHQIGLRAAESVSALPGPIVKGTERKLAKVKDHLKLIDAPAVKGMSEKAAIEKLKKADVNIKKVKINHEKMTFKQLVEKSETGFFGEVEEQRLSTDKITLTVPEADTSDELTVAMLDMGSRLAWPLPGYETLSSYFGHRSSPGGVGSTDHQGIDVPAPYGTPIIAVKEGTVELASHHGGYGNCVIIDHENGYKSLYGHMTAITCNVGDKVKPGDIIGKVGSTGWSTGSHLHFGLMKEGEFIDPEPFFTGKENIKAGEEVSENIQGLKENEKDAEEKDLAKEIKKKEPVKETKQTTTKAPTTTKPTTQATTPPETKPQEPETQPPTQPTTKPNQSIEGEDTVDVED